MFSLSRRQFALSAAVAVPTAVVGGFVPGARRALAHQAESVGVGGVDPFVAVTPDGGTVYLAWFQPAEINSIQFARSTDGGASFTGVVTASGDDTDVISLSQSSPAIALGANGEIYLVYARNTPHPGVDFGRY
jgi:hypothetical protein